MKRFGWRGLFALLLLMLGSYAQAAEIKVAGGGGPVENILKPIKEPFEKATGLKLTIIPAGGTNAFKELTRGSIDAATAGFSFEDLQAALQKEGFSVADLPAYQPLTIGKGGVFIFAQKDNTVARLTKEQAKGIFTGKIQNWKEVGGRDMPVLVVIGKLNPATNNVFQKLMLDNEPYLKDVLDATTAEDVKKSVAANAEAVAFGPSTLLDGTVRAVEAPEVSRPIILITKGKPSPDVQKLIDFIGGDGRTYIKP